MLAHRHIIKLMRVAWFSPLPPVRSGVADLNARLLPALEHGAAIDRYPEAAAHDFPWTHRRDPYDLAVYHLGNAACHDYLWAYMRHLRRKLEADPEHPVYLRSEPGFGYVLDCPPANAGP